MSQKIKTFINILFLFTCSIILLVAPISPTNFDLEVSSNLYPDLLICLIFAILINKPQISPTYIVLLLCVFADILLMKPIGLYSALIFIAAELIRRYNKLIRKESFLIHWLIFFSCLTAIELLSISIHKLFFMPAPNLMLSTKQILLTSLFYPLFDLPLKFFLRKDI